MMTINYRVDLHNDTKMQTLDWATNQSRIFLYAYKIRCKAHDVC